MFSLSLIIVIYWTLISFLVKNDNAEIYIWNYHDLQVKIAIREQVGNRNVQNVMSLWQNDLYATYFKTINVKQ